MLGRIVMSTLLVCALAGCDGYARSFQASSATIGTSPTEQQLVYVVTKVARDRGFTQRPATQSHHARYTVISAFTKQTSEHDWINLKLVRDSKDDALRFIIVDWPSFTRSDESRQVEAEIRAQLGATSASNQEMQLTPSRTAFTFHHD